MQPKKIKTSAGMETVDETVARAKAQLGDAYVAPKATIQPTVSANDLANPPTTPTITPTPEPTLPDQSKVDGVLGSIRSTSENAKKLAEQQAIFGQFAEDSSGFKIQEEQLQKFGVTPEKLSRLEDIQLQLSERNTESALTKTRIEGGAGQTIGQSGREVTQEAKENAVRNAGLASEAAVLQGNIETGRALANDAVNIALQDRTFKATAMLQQINDMKDVVNEETRQLLVKEERTYEAELARIAEIKENVSTAMINGASQSEMQFMTDPKTPDDVKLRVAQAITARGANQMRNLQIAQSNASIASSYASAAASRASTNRANYELQLLQQPADPNQLDPVTLKTLEGLDAGAKVEIRDARNTVGQIDRMKELINKNGDLALLTPATEDGREFLRIRADVVDKLARQRTGAVVGTDEEATFKDILGVGPFDIITKDKDEMLKGLNSFQNVHNETLSLNDPTGRVRTYLDAQSLDTEDGQQINTVWGVPTSQTLNQANYFQQ